MADETQQDPQDGTPKLGVKEFAAKIKAKYPDYAGIDDSTLVQKIITKYPEYKDQIDFSQKKNPLPTSQPSYSESAPSQSPSASVAQSTPKGTQSVQPTKPQPFDPNTFMRQTRAAVINQPQDNTIAVQPEQTKSAIDSQLGKEDYQKRKAEINKEAVVNSTAQYLKNKGINAPVGSVQFNQQLAKTQDLVNSGQATVAINPDGQIGLKRVTGFLENIKNGWNEATKSAEEANDFTNNMTTPQRVDYVKSHDIPQPDQFIGEQPSTLGSLAHFAGGAAPFLGKAAVGAGIGALAVAGAPESMGASLAGLPTALSFILTAPDMANQGAQQEIIRRYQILKSQNPDMSDVDAMEEAGKGALAGGIGGILTNAALMGTGLKTPLSLEAKGVVGKTLQEVGKSALHMGGVSAGVTAAQQLEGEAEGIHTSTSDKLKAIEDSFKENATTGAMLTALMHGVPKIMESAIKYSLKDTPPEQIRNVLQANENAGTVPEGTTEKVMKDISSYNDALNKTVDGLTPEATASVAGLIQKKNSLIEESKTKDDSFKPVYKEKIDAIDRQIQDIQRTGKPFEHEIDEVTGKPYQQPTYDDVAQQQVQELAQKIAKGKQVTDPTDLQTQANFPKELEAELQKLQKEEQTSNKGKENPKTVVSDNINEYLKAEPAVSEKPAEPVSSPVISDTEKEPIPITEQPTSEPTNIEENTSSNKPEVVPSTTDLEGFGGRGGRNRLYERVKNLDEPADIDGKILHYFAGGGKVHPESFSKEVVGMKRRGYGDEGTYPSEVKGNTLVKATDENGKPNPSIKQLAESFGDGTNDQEIRNKIIDVLQSHGSRESAATEFVNKYDQEYIEAKHNKEQADAYEAYEKKLQEDEQNYLTEKGQEQDEIEQDPEYIKHLIKQYETETVQGNDKRSETGSETESNQARSTPEDVKPEGADKSERPSGLRGSAEDQPKPDEGKPETPERKIGDPLRHFADIVEKGKISKLGGFKASTGFDAVWDGSLTVVAETLRKTADLADAIQAGLEHIKNSDWYKNLTDKKDFDEKYVAHLEGEYGKFKEQPENKPEQHENSGTVGISHEALNALAEKIGLPEIERGKSYDPKELADRGRKLLNAGADPNKIADDFYSNGQTDENGVSVVRAKIEQLFKTGEQITDKKSTSFKENFDQLSKFMQVEKDMGTFAHRVIKSFQGQRDIDTDSFVYVSMAAQRKLGRELNKEEKTKIDGLTKQVSNLKKQVSEYEERLKNAIDKDLTGESKPEVKLSISEKAKKLADAIRRGKAHKPGVFSAATPASLVWDAAVETTAQVVEKGGQLVDAIQKGVEYIKGTDWYKGLSEDKKKEAEDAFVKAHRDSEGTSLESLQEMLADKKGDKFTPQEAKAIWDYAKTQYLNKGSDYLQMLSGVANDLGYTMTQVSKAIITPKTQRISDEMWKQRSELYKNRSSVKRWLDNKGGNLAYKGFKTAMDTFREAAVFGHGAIFIGTHAMPTFFDIPRAKYAIKGFFNAYRAAYGKTGNYELMIADLKNSENYLKAQRAGLQNNPERIGSDTEIISHHLKWFTSAGERGFNAIKILRQNLFDSHYNALPETLKQDPTVLKEIAQIINNATGATNAKVPNWMREVTFAGGMEISRWERIVKNPPKAVGILFKVAKGNATPAEKVFLRVWATRAGTIAGVYTSALIVNNAINAYLYPDDDKKRINFFNPSKGDWFKLKFGSVVIDPTSGMGTSLRFLTTIASMPFESEKYIKSHNQGDNRKNALAKKVLGYGLGKLSPGYTTIGELVLKHDYTGNTIPFSNDKPFYKSARKLTLTEYGEHKLPLPLAEGFEIYHDAAHEAGADDKTWNAYMKGIMFGGLSGLTGVRSYEDTKAAEPVKKETIVPYYHSPD